MFNTTSRYCSAIFFTSLRRGFCSKPAKQFRPDVVASGGNSAGNSSSSPDDDGEDRVRFADARLCLSSDSRFASIELIPRACTSGSPQCLRVPLVWLRDHCRSPGAYNSRTNQRRSDCTDLFARAALADDCYPINFDADAQQLKLSWADGQESQFSSNELLQWALFSKKRYEECSAEHEDGSDTDCPSRTLWTGQSVRELPAVAAAPQLDFALFARLLIRFGIVGVHGVDASDERATRALCEHIAPLFGTLFGDFWTFGPSLDSGSGDTQHTEMVFHCLRPAPQGGRTILVDGFAAAERLRAESPPLFRALSEHSVEHEYLESSGADRAHARAFREPVIRLFPRATSKIAQIRFNPYDRAPMRTLQMNSEDGDCKALEDTVHFYAAYQRFAQLVNEPHAQFRVALRPGTVLFIDNFRVLHGRTAFQGPRLMCGCYLNRDVLLAKARPLLSPNFYRNV